MLAWGGMMETLFLPQSPLSMNYNQDGTNQYKTCKVGVMFPSETLYALVP